MHAGLGGLHRVVLVMDRRGGTGQVVDFVYFHKKRKGHVMTHELEAWLTMQVVNVAFGASEQVVHAQDFMSLLQQAITQMRTEEAGSTSDQNSFACFIITHS